MNHPTIFIQRDKNKTVKNSHCSREYLQKAYK